MSILHGVVEYSKTVPLEKVPSNQNLDMELLLGTNYKQIALLYPLSKQITVTSADYTAASNIDRISGLRNRLRAIPAIESGEEDDCLV